MDPTVWPTTDMSFLSDDNAQSVNLTDVVGNDDFMAQVTCYLNPGGNEFEGDRGAHISAIFVVLVVSTAVTFFPVLATKQTKVKIPLYVYLFARYFGAGVIIATAFIQ
jgi:zinc transporter 1/2/3